MPGNSAARRGLPAATTNPPGEARAVDQARQWLSEHGVMAGGPGQGPSRPSPPAATRAGVPSAGEPPVGRRRVTRSGESERVESDAVELAAVERRSVDASDDRATGDPDANAQADPEEVARTIVLRKLAAKARTRHELHQALQTRKVPAQASDAVLDRMEEVGLIDDAAFATDWVESRQQRRHLSAMALRQELHGKGIDRDQIDAALDRVDASAEFDAALALAERKAAAMSSLTREVRYRRLAGVLARRGFGPGLTTQVLAQVLGGP